MTAPGVVAPAASWAVATPSVPVAPCVKVPVNARRTPVSRSSSAPGSAASQACADARSFAVVDGPDTPSCQVLIVTRVAPAGHAGSVRPVTRSRLKASAPCGTAVGSAGSSTTREVAVSPVLVNVTVAVRAVSAAPDRYGSAGVHVLVVLVDSTGTTVVTTSTVEVVCSWSPTAGRTVTVPTCWPPPAGATTVASSSTPIAVPPWSATGAAAWS